MTTAAHLAVTRDAGMSQRWQIIQLLRRPRTAREIAAALSLGKTTAGWHLNKLEAMGIARRAEVVDQMQILELNAQQAAKPQPHAIGGPETAQV